MTVRQGHRQTTRSCVGAKTGALLVLFLMLAAGGSAFAQGSIYGTVQNSGGSYPAQVDLLWWGFLDDTDEEIRIESNTGAGYDGMNWWDDFQNYTTEAAGNPYDYYYNNLNNGESYHLAKLIPSNSAQQENIVLASATNPAQPGGLAGAALSATNVLVRWHGVAGITYHVYRRNTSNNGVFRRVDDPTGSLSNAGVADSFFVDATSDGITNYTYLIVGENASGDYSAHSVEVAVDAATNATPTIASILPATGPTVGGTLVTIAGTGFDPDGATVTIGGASATSVTVVSPFEITCLTPAGSGTVDIVVANTASALSSAPLVGGFVYYANTAPVADAG
ncbi:IPT/TIG domain-containing protein, partial [Candidatus Zixiibacteriota bacterium]